MADINVAISGSYPAYEFEFSPDDFFVSYSPQPQRFVMGFAQGTTGFRFLAIRFYPKGNPSGLAPMAGGPNQDGSEIIITDDNENQAEAGDFSYVVQVMDSSSRVVWSPDPEVDNETED